MYLKGIRDLVDCSSVARITSGFVCGTCTAETAVDFMNNGRIMAVVCDGCTNVV